MLLHLTTQEIFWRLLSAVVGASLIGFDRGEHGHNVGLRTTLLVCLAACLAMLQANALLDMSGKTPESFAVMDLMRLPLGILSGMGFIGGGAILRKENLVSGVTTAATLWFVTVIGLCFGGGQLALGWIGIGLGLFVLTALRGFERRIHREINATLTIQLNSSGPSEKELHARLLENQMKISTTKISILSEEPKVRIEWKIRWKSGQTANNVPPLIATLSSLPSVSFVDWSP